MFISETTIANITDMNEYVEVKARKYHYEHRKLLSCCFIEYLYRFVAVLREGRRLNFEQSCSTDCKHFLHVELKYIRNQQVDNIVQQSRANALLGKEIKFSA